MKRSSAGTCGTFGAVAETMRRSRAARGCARRWRAGPAASSPCSGCGKTAVPGTRGSRARLEVVHEVVQRPFLRAGGCRGTISRPRRQVVMTVNTTSGDEQRQPAAVEDLGQVAERNVSSRPPKATAASDELPRLPVPEHARDEQQQHRVDDQGAGDRDAVGGGQPRGGAEREHHDQDPDEQQAVDARAGRSGRPRARRSAARSPAAAAPAAPPAGTGRTRRRSPPGWR